jgi:hypothetical protein
VTSGGIIGDLQSAPRRRATSLRSSVWRTKPAAPSACCGRRLPKHAGLAQNELPAIVIGRLELSEDNPPTIIVDQVQSIDASARRQRVLVLRTPQHDDFSTLCDSILSVLSTNPGDCEVRIEALMEEGTLCASSQTTPCG